MDTGSIFRDFLNPRKITKNRNFVQNCRFFLDAVPFILHDILLTKYQVWHGKNTKLTRNARFRVPLWGALVGMSNTPWANSCQTMDEFTTVKVFPARPQITRLSILPV